MQPDLGAAPHRASAGTFHSVDSVIVGALIGVGGVAVGGLITVGGSLLTERLRTGREKEARLHGVRQELYSRFMTSSDRLASWVQALRSYPDHAPEEVDDSGGPIDIDGWAQDQARLTAEISLIGHPDVVSSAKQVVYTLYEWADFRVAHQESGLLNKDTNVAPDDHEDPADLAYDDEARELQDAEAELAKWYRAANLRCVEAMRKDLGAPTLNRPRPSWAGST